MANKRINVASLDYEGIRNNLKEFLRGQEQFKDFDYEGSNMAVLLDVLAFNTHYNSLYANMAVNENFIDSASKRSSVVSIAKSLGYTPKTRKSAQALLSFTVADVPGDPDFLVVPRYTTFQTSKDGVKYLFNTIEEYSAEADASRRFLFPAVTVLEGAVSSMRFVVTPTSRFVIPSKDVESSTLRVKVEDSETYKSFKFYVNADRESKIDGSSTVYFMKETFDGFTELVFGDGVFGKQLENGNIVTVEYLLSKGSAANSIKRGFGLAVANTLPGTLLGLIVMSAEQGGTFGGAERESIEEIRFNAPNLYASQGRAVTETDYEAIITEKVPTVDQCIVWGGEKNVPPVYGKVFVCAKTTSGAPLTFTEKEHILRSVIDPLKVMSVVTEFVDPANIDVILDVRVYYDPRQTASRDSDIVTYTKQVALQYGANELGKFNRVFRASQLSRLIELSDDGIVSTVIRPRIGFEIVPSFAVSANYEVHTGNPLVPGSLQSEAFYMLSARDPKTDVLTPLYFDDDGAGAVRLYSLADGVRVYAARAVGSIDYSTGSVRLEDLKIHNAIFSNLRLSATPSSSDVAGFNFNVLRLSPEQLKISAVRDSVDSRGANGFTFSPNRV